MNGDVVTKIQYVAPNALGGLALRGACAWCERPYTAVDGGLVNCECGESYHVFDETKPRDFDGVCRKPVPPTEPAPNAYEVLTEVVKLVEPLTARDRRRVLRAAVALLTDE